MGENKESDFWKSSDDDFWNKPVASEDWLKNDTSQDEGFRKEDSNADKTLKEPSVDPALDNNPYANPYLNPIAAKEETALQKESQASTEKKDKPYQSPYKASEKQRETKKQKEPEKPKNTEKAEKNPAAQTPEKTVHIHAIICLIFIFAAVLSVVITVFLGKHAKAKGIKEAAEVSYKETAVDSFFEQYGNNRVFLEDYAVTVLEDCKPAGDSGEENKLICIYAEVVSDEYVRESYALSDIYIGYEKNGRNEYRIPLRSDVILPYISSLGFTKADLLNNYGIGNGSNTAGYFFFYVPDEAEEITFYAEEREMRVNISYLKEVFYKEMKVLPKDDAFIKTLTEREADAW